MLTEIICSTQITGSLIQLYSEYFSYMKYRYSIGRDPGAWFRINQNTGEITLSKVVDWESSYVTNGQYIAEVLAITRGKKQIFSSETKLFIQYIFFNSTFSHMNSLFIVSVLPPDQKYLLFTGVPRYTATGTIVLTMQDTRDNCPAINTELRKVCMHSPSVIITAKSINDQYALPFTFSIHGEPQTTWIIRSINGKLTHILYQYIIVISSYLR